MARGLKVFQELPSRCTCAVCGPGCQCGDCATCSNAALDATVTHYAKGLVVGVCVFLFLGGFVFLVPVMAMGATPNVTEPFSLRVQPADNSTRPLGSIGFCYLGLGAVLVHGVYYPAAQQNLTAKRVCK